MKKRENDKRRPVYEGLGEKARRVLRNIYSSDYHISGRQRFENRKNSILLQFSNVFTIIYLRFQRQLNNHLCCHGDDYSACLQWLCQVQEKNPDHVIRDIKYLPDTLSACHTSTF